MGAGTEMDLGGPQLIRELSLRGSRGPQIQLTGPRKNLGKPQKQLGVVRCWVGLLVSWSNAGSVC